MIKGTSHPRGKKWISHQMDFFFIYNETLKNRSNYVSRITDNQDGAALLRSAIYILQRKISIDETA